mmetsp:Transcript_12054/g.30930  ORF Transcript_12054/g.30930 Transcript_12054/m.30930 type:complete len:285 (+) Transcript_12054:292-1146(+)
MGTLAAAHDLRHVALVDVHAHLHAVVADGRTPLHLRASAGDGRLQVPHGVEAERGLRGVRRQLQHWRAESRELVVRIWQAVAAPSVPGVAAALAHAAILRALPEFRLVQRGDRLTLRVHVHLHHIDLACTSELDLVARHQLSDLCRDLGAISCEGARSQNLCPDADVGIRRDGDRGIHRHHQPGNCRTAVVDLHLRAICAGAVGRPVRWVGGAVPKGPLAHAGRHEVLGFRRPLVGVLNALRGQGHAEVEQGRSKSVVDVLQIDCHRFKLVRDALANVLEEVVV